MSDNYDDWDNIEWLKEFEPTFGPEYKMNLAKVQKEKAIKELLNE